ncbi:dihydrolipoyl dehydrogenase [Pseudoxanthomonas sp. NC8]|nr:dihydrolipoyl dehydrogenase [Pseudoxanthomonas sp. NC8]
MRTVQGVAKFVSPNELEIAGSDGKTQLLRFEQCIIAAGSQAVKLPNFPWDDARVMDSTDALQLADVPKSLLVVGGGIIGLEMATVYRALGAEVTVVEFMDQLMPGADKDMVKPLADRLKKQGVIVHLKTKAAKVEASKKGITVSFESATEGAKPELESGTWDRVLVAVGRSPNGGKLDAGKAGVQVTDRGFIPVDRQMRTNVPHIFAIGDLVGQPMLAHKATHEGKLAAEVAAGEKKEWVARVIPSVAYTDPEIAWVGVTETEAKAKGLKIGVGKFPWVASARAVGIGRGEGFTKLIFDEHTHRIIGAGITGVHAGDLISELALAIEMGAEAGDIGATIHPHPTLARRWRWRPRCTKARSPISTSRRRNKRAAVADSKAPASPGLSLCAAAPLRPPHGGVAGFGRDGVPRGVQGAAGAMRAGAPMGAAGSGRNPPWLAAATVIWR